MPWACTARPENVYSGVIPSRVWLTAALAIVLLWLPSATAAHDIPSTVTVIAFVKPEGQRLHLLVRVPLASMRDVNFPQRGAGYLDIAGSDSLIHDAARTWLAGYLELYEEGERLTGESLRAARISLPSDRSFVSY